MPAETITAPDRPVEIVSKPAQKSSRNHALDFTKGALVLIMVLYHWLNYFYGTQGDVYKYLRFLTPSFIFITGFLISNVYFSKYGVADPRLSHRLIVRGLKILGVFILLNVVRSLLLPGVSKTQILSQHASLSNLVTMYVVGNGLGGGQAKVIAFYILVPIAYLLLLSAVLALASRFYRHIFYAVCALCFLSIFILGQNNAGSANLELLAIGLLGIIFGYVPIEKVNSFVNHPYLVAIGYFGYLAAITIWNVVYPLQVVGVCLSLMVLYLLANPQEQPGGLRGRVILLGKYSLFGYVAQIAILQVLYRLLGHGRPGAGRLATSLLAAFALTILVVETTDWLRARVVAVDKMYKAVFA
jgi:peptidoglycan/LPS O-acetylase OafA/YrhL